jgi:ATP-dependent helicase/nuclease subunit A
MHKSKGLQFPVVFCLGLEKGLKGKAGGAVRLDEELGLCLRYKVPEWRLSRRTAADEIFEWKKAHDVKAEKICLLYVAVTRAQQKLFLVGASEDRALWHMPSGDHRALAASDYLDCILPALYDEEEKSTTFVHCLVNKPSKETGRKSCSSSCQNACKPIV